MRNINAAYAGLLALAAAAPALAHDMGEYAPGHGGGAGHVMDGWHFIFGPLMMVLAIALIVVVVVLLVRWLGGGSRGAAGERGGAARAMLDERYAKGEIDRTEYLERKKDLS